MNFEDKLVNGYLVKLFEELDGRIYGVYYFAGSWNSSIWSLEGYSYSSDFNLVPTTYWRIDGATVEESTSDASGDKLVGNYFTSHASASLALAKQLALTRVMVKLSEDYGNWSLRVREGKVIVVLSDDICGTLLASNAACTYVAENMSDDVKLVLC